MKSRDLNEIDLVQNAALGACLVWRFCVDYQSQSLDSQPQLPLAFLVLPVCLHADTVTVALGTRASSGLTLFAAKLSEIRENLLAIHTRALALRELSLQSIGFGASASLLRTNYTAATIRGADTRPPPIPERVRPNWEAAGRFGYWCGTLSVQQIATILKVDF
jgi:hypothetical protein